MSEQVVQVPPVDPALAPPPAVRPARGFLFHAKIIGLLTLASRVLGLLRESLATNYFGTGLVANAFSFAFTIPNLFRRLFGEGALSAAFIPLYSRAIREDHPEEARRFAAASVNLLAAILITITLVGEAVLWAIATFCPLNYDRLLAVKLTAIMLPYVLLVCGTAFMGAILQVHRRFGMTAAAPIVLNVGLIAGTVLAARMFDIRAESGRIQAIYFISISVLVAGALQVAMLVPSLRAVGFRFELRTFWTPAIRRMLKLSIPVALGAGVLQLSVLLDRGISLFLAQSMNADDSLDTHFTFLGYAVRYPLEFGATTRLALAQLLYQFPLGIFAIALATAIFPTLSADALDADREKFRKGLRQGIRMTLWEGLPASIGLILVAQPAVQVLFQRGLFRAEDTFLTASSLQFYAIAIWAFSLQQILNRAYYALHDTMTPLIMSVVTLVVSLAIKLPLLWTMGEAAMAAGTSVAFTLQVIVMLFMLSRRTGGLGLKTMGPYVVKLIVATALMGGACWLVQLTPVFPGGDSKSTALVQLVILTGTGVVVYGGACLALGVMPAMRRKKIAG